VREVLEKLEWFWRGQVGGRIMTSAAIAGTARVEDKLVYRAYGPDRRRNGSNINVCRNSPERFGIDSSIRSTANR